MKEKRTLHGKKSGFTIVELLIVVVVIAILAAITIVAFNGITSQAEDAKAKSDLSNASKKLELYRVQFGAYPTSIDSTTYCPVPAALDYCLQPSEGNTLANYTVNNSANPPTYTINLLSSKGAQYYASDNTAPSSSTDTFTIGTITGTARTGSTLTSGALTPSGATVSRQWQKGAAAGGPFTNIAGATSNTYAVPGGDIGSYIRIIATGTGTYSGTATSAATARITTLVTAIAPITGTTTVGSTLTAGARTPAAATVSYQWNRNGVAISGATASTYTLISADLGTTITVTAVGTTNYSGSVTSAATTTIN